MLRKTIFAAGVAAMMAMPVGAFDISEMTDAERDAFGEAVREYLLENPGVLMEAISVLEEREAEARAEAEIGLIASLHDDIFNDGFSYTGGNLDGDVVLVEFIDYKCGFCRRAHPEVAQLLEMDGNIRKVIKEFPILGEESVEASRFAISVLQVDGPEAYKDINDTLIAFRGTFTREAFERIADDKGLSTRKIMRRMDTDEVTQVIRANYALAEQLQINGTPGFVFEDRLLRGYVPLDGLLQVVNEVRGG